jgi:hypothetical protein
MTASRLSSLYLLPLKRFIKQKINLSFAALAAIIAVTILQGWQARQALSARRLHSLRRNACHDIRHGQDSDEDSGGLFALHARRF